MSHREFVYYIDPNNELWVHRKIIQRYMEEYLDGKARLANDQEIENIICLTKYNVKTDNRFKFDHITHQTLKKLMWAHTQVLNLDPYEVIEFLKMGLSKDIETRTLGINTLIKYQIHKERSESIPVSISLYNNSVSIGNRPFHYFSTNAVYWLLYNYGFTDNPLHKTYELSINTKYYLGSQISLLENIINKKDSQIDSIQKLKEVIYEHICSRK